MTEHDYEAGLRDGKISALEKLHAKHEERISKLEETLKLQEKVTWGLIGAIGLVQFLPKLEALFK